LEKEGEIAILKKILKREKETITKSKNWPKGKNKENSKRDEKNK
jgi:hypothetical protein